MAQPLRSQYPLVIRCLAEQVDSQWQVFSLEFGLAAQADSFPAAKKKLESMLDCYIKDALVGEDREHASELLSRRAPLFVYARYHYYNMLQKFDAWIDGNHDTKVFQEAVPLVPAHCR